MVRILIFLGMIVLHLNNLLAKVNNSFLKRVGESMRTTHHLPPTIRLKLYMLYIDLGGKLDQHELTKIICTHKEFRNKKFLEMFIKLRPAFGNILRLYMVNELQDMVCDLLCTEIAAGKVHYLIVLPHILDTQQFSPVHHQKILEMYIKHVNPKDPFSGLEMLCEKFPEKAKEIRMVIDQSSAQ